MRTLHSGVPAAALAVVLSLAACATASRLEQPYQQGRLGEVARIFDSSPDLWAHEGDVYRAIVACALPGSPAYQPALAGRYIRRYLELYPGGDHAPEVRHIGQLIEEVARLHAAVDVSGRRADRLAADSSAAVTLQARVDSLGAVVAAQEGRLDSLRSAARTDVRQRDLLIHSLQDELDRLKAIDLAAPGRAAPARPGRPPKDTAGGRM